MADILPYLGVEKHFSETDAAGQTAIMEDLTEMTQPEADKILKQQGLTARYSGTEGIITGQIPAAGQKVPVGSEVLLYLGETPEEQTVTVPDFTGMHRQQAVDAAGQLGLYILVSGNQEISPRVTVTAQSIPKDTPVSAGTTITLTFTDSAAKD